MSERGLPQGAGQVSETARSQVRAAKDIQKMQSVLLLSTYKVMKSWRTRATFNETKVDNFISGGEFVGKKLILAHAIIDSIIKRRRGDLQQHE
ncbi:unnamed protein product [Boreogadus saida]